MAAISGEYYEEYQNDGLFYQSSAVTVMDARTGFVIYENAQHDLMYPASITKIMTALLVLEEIGDLQEEIVFSERAIYLPDYAARIQAEPGDTMTVYEALHALMLASGNEVANALAEHVSGSIPAFVSRMNTRSRELNAVNTRFVNPCGLPGDGQHTTAFDISLIMQEAIQHPIFNEIIATPYFSTGPMENFPYGLLLRNTNRMIREGDYFNPHVIGGKTGFTFAAQHTLVSYVRRGEHELIISVLYAPNRVTFTDTEALMDYVFAMPIATVFDSGAHYWEVPVVQEIDGEASQISVVSVRGRGDIRVPVPDNMYAVRYEVHIPEYIAPPVRVGDVVGHKIFYAGSAVVGEVELVSVNSALPWSAEIRTQPIQSTQAVFLDISPENASTLLNFFAVVPAVTLLIICFMAVAVRRHRRMMRRRRRIARAR